MPVILRIICDTTGLGFGVIARMTETSWTACAVLDRVGFGRKVGEPIDLVTTLCHKIYSTRTPIIINKASEDPVYCEHPAPKLQGFESYISVPIIRRNGDMFGTICALDPKPAALSEARVLSTLQLFAELVAAQLDVEERLDASQSALAHANETAALRDQFIAVLGHDLRNPIGAVTAGLEWLSRRPLDARAATLVAHLQQSCGRMSGLVNDILDFARGRLGGGIPVVRRETADLDATLLQVIEELRSVHRQRLIETDLDLRAPVLCDPQRIGQLLSNLLVNALTHGAGDRPVRIAGHSLGGALRLSVSNEGTPIPPAAMTRLFQPFSCDVSGGKPAGLGLGVYIASEIAGSHGGRLSVSSTADATVFTLDIPASLERLSG